YLLKKDDTPSRFFDSAARTAPQSSSPSTAASRPRRVGNEQVNTAVPKLTGASIASNSRQPTLAGTPVGTPVNGASNVRPLSSSPPSTREVGEEKTGVEEVGEGDVVRIDTTLVTVPVSVLDRQGRFVPDLRREDFRVFENG